MFDVAMQRVAWQTLFWAVQGTKPLSRQADDALRAAGREIMEAAGVEMDGEGNLIQKNDSPLEVRKLSLSRDAAVGCKVALVSALLGKVSRDGSPPSVRDRDIYLRIAGRFGDLFRARVEEDAPLPEGKPDDDSLRID
jgi:hypothetical protein